MEQNRHQIRNSPTHISLEHYDTSLHQTNSEYLLTNGIFVVYEKKSNNLKPSKDRSFNRNLRTRLSQYTTIVWYANSEYDMLITCVVLTSRARE